VEENKTKEDIALLKPDYLIVSDVDRGVGSDALFR
jgi:hypothetical protein